VAIGLGSGLGFLADEIEAAVRIPYREIPGFPPAGVSGHAGELVGGRYGGVPVLVQSGRFHLYEGHAPAVAALPVRLFNALGIGTLIVTNAAGSLRPAVRCPALMLIADHLNFMWRNPLTGPLLPGETRFPDMSDPYDAGLRAMAREAARQEHIGLEVGVYAGLLGPSYETPAEVRMLQRLGADAVGMSTVPEVIAARARGMRCLGFSLLTNPAAGLSHAKLSHQDVLAAADPVAGQLGALITRVVSQL